MKTFETCLCGIAKVDCTFHKPLPEKPNFVNNNNVLPGSFMTWDIEGDNLKWVKFIYENGQWRRV